MYTRKRYRAIELALWTRFETLAFIVLIIGWVCAYQFLDLDWLRIPWTPMALIGTAVAFVIGFQNNAVYGRIWEARKIWGGVVNTSRTFGVFVRDMISNDYCPEPKSDDYLNQQTRILTYRHIAWMVALRHAMRASKPWETTTQHRTNQEWDLKPPEVQFSLEEELEPYLSKEDFSEIMQKDNKQTALLYQQSAHLKRLRQEGLLWEFSFWKWKE